MSNLTKNFALLFFFTFVSILANAQVEKSKHNPGAQKAINVPDNNAKVEQPVLPADFPKFVDTGHPEADAAAFKQAKIDWYATHPADAERINGEKGTQTIKRAEYDKLPAEKKQAILNNPSRFIIVD